ncbi:MAG: hypothetical protein K6B65_02970 [Bacilli bacterium]|nr:hypothetical protein [Bacilli bacterium]
MANPRRDYSIIVEGKRMLEVFFYHSSGKEAHVSIRKEAGSNQYEFIYDPKFDVPTSFDQSQCEVLAREHLRGTYYGSYYYDDSLSQYNSIQAEKFIEDALERLDGIEGPDPYFAHYGRELLSIYFDFPYLYKEIGVSIYDFAKFFYPVNLNKQEEYRLFREAVTALKFGVPFFLRVIESGNVSIDFATALQTEKPRFIEALMKEIDKLSTNSSNDAILCDIASKYPFINSPKANAVLLKENHGIGIRSNALFPYLIERGSYDEVAYVLIHSPVYRTILARSKNSPYLYYLSLLKSHGYEEEADEVARDICKKTDDPVAYSYLCHLFSKEEKIALIKGNEVRTFPCSNYTGENRVFSLFLADINPSVVEENAQFVCKYKLYGAGLLPIKALDSSTLTEYKKNLRSLIKNGTACHSPSKPLSLTDSVVLTAIKFNDAPSIRMIFGESDQRKNPAVRVHLAELKRKYPKKADTLKPYITKKGESDVS